MSASTYFHVVLRCNGDDCGAHFHGQPMEKRGMVRKRASRLAGWTHTRNPRGHAYDDDYCLRHRQENATP